MSPQSHPAAARPPTRLDASSGSGATSAAEPPPARVCDEPRLGGPGPGEEPRGEELDANALEEVLTIAAEAHHLGGGHPGAAAAMLAAAEARAHARLGDRAALLEKLRLAEVDLGRAPSSERVPSVFGSPDPRRMLDAGAA
jgi:hypothetical protein